MRRSPPSLHRARNRFHTPGQQLLDLIGARVQFAGADQQALFVAAYRASWTMQSFESALKQLQSARLEGSGRQPLVVLPYLDEEKLASLAERQVSGLDLCGNALLLFPDLFLVQRSGQPNRFRAERGLQSPYTGKAALVGRTLLLQPRFQTANALLASIHDRGGTLSQALLSRTLKALATDLVIAQDRLQGVRVIQPARLLDRLVKGWQDSSGGLSQREGRVLWRGKVNLPPEQLLAALSARAQQTGQRFTATGLVTSSRFANISSGGERYAYVDEVGDLLEGLDVQETRRFPNLELWRAPDDAVYYDTTTDEGVVWASSVQTYLELATGDARTQQVAVGLRQLLLEEAEVKLAASSGRENL